MADKVLLIDDEKDFLDALAERMRTRNVDVTKSTSAKDALKKVETESYDAVVLDLMMPEMDGLEALKILMAKDPKLQVILLTGHATVQKGVEAMKLGAMELLEKPTNFDTLMDKIKHAKARRMVLVSQESEEHIKKILSDKGW
jgi:DNA-binding NtrC family response regulator